MGWGQSPPKPMTDISNRLWHFSHQTLKKPQNPTPRQPLITGTQPATKLVLNLFATRLPSTRS